MQSIFIMPSDDMAGVAERRVPLPVRNAFRRPGRGRRAARAVTLEEEGKCEAFKECLPTTWQGPQSGACRYLRGGRQMRSISIMPSDDLAGAAERRVPLPYLE